MTGFAIGITCALLGAALVYAWMVKTMFENMR